MDREQLGAVWAPAPTVDPAQLDDAGLTSYRHPAEWRALVLIPITLIVVGLVLALLGPSLREGLHWAPRPLVGAILSATDPPGFVVMVVIVFVVTALLDILAQYRETTTILWQGAEITPTTFPRHYPVIEELRRRFRMPRTRV